MKPAAARDFELVPCAEATLCGGLQIVDGPAGKIEPGVRSAWQALALDASEPNSFQEPWFAIPGLDRLAAGDPVHRLEVWDGASLIGILHLGVSGRYGRMPVRNVQNWKHHHDFLGTPLVRHGRERAFWGAVLSHLDRAAWAAGFLHLEGMVEGGPVVAGLADSAATLGRSCPIVHREVRAALATGLPPAQYYERQVRKKKRKELKRLANRLAEQGELRSEILAADGNLAAWCDAFLALERSGWKGRAGSALACRTETELFFREALAGARAAGRLEMRRLDLDGRPIAMLVNFLAPPGSFSFKIAFDESYAHFSPGVLLQIDNLAILEREGMAWMDSCAAENHPMIESLWGERRALVRVTIRLAGLRRGFTHAACRAAERLWTAVKPRRPGTAR